MAKKKPETIYQIRIALDHIRPPIWRRVLVPGKYTLADLHVVIQIAMGWEFSHLHAFTIDEQSFSSAEEMEFDEFEDMEDEAEYRLMDVVEEGSRFHYEYDFGDSWEHTLQVEKVSPAEEGQLATICIKGKRACPPEDVGGFPGYLHFLEVMENPEDPEYGDFMEWIGGSFDPEAFDIEEINKALASFDRGDLLQLSAQETAEDLLASEETRSKFLAIQNLEAVQSLRLLGMMNAMLTYIRDNKVTGTKSKGNIPRKAVREIIEGSPYAKDLLSMIGGAPGNFRNVEEFPPFVYTYSLAVEADLITGGPGEQWHMTLDGEAFLNEDPRIQLGVMFLTWWYEINWLMATPLAALGSEMTDELRPLAYQSLIPLPVDQVVPFHKYAEPFLKDLNTSFEKNSTIKEEVLSNFLGAVILVPLQGFGIIRIDVEVSQPDSAEFPIVKAVKLTPLGKEILSILPAQ
jgi:hypothetical protein